MWLDSKAVNCPQKWGNFNRSRGQHQRRSYRWPSEDCRPPIQEFRHNYIPSDVLLETTKMLP